MNQLQIDIKQNSVIENSDFHRTKLSDRKNPSILAYQALGACLSPYNDFFNLYNKDGLETNPSG